MNSVSENYHVIPTAVLVNYNMTTTANLVNYLMTSLDQNSIKLCLDRMFQYYHDEDIYRLCTTSCADQRVKKNYSEWHILADICLNKDQQVR